MSPYESFPHPQEPAQPQQSQRRQIVGVRGASSCAEEAGEGSSLGHQVARRGKMVQEGTDRLHSLPRKSPRNHEEIETQKGEEDLHQNVEECPHTGARTVPQPPPKNDGTPPHPRRDHQVLQEGGVSTGPGRNPRRKASKNLSKTRGVSESDRPDHRALSDVDEGKLDSTVDKQRQDR